MIESFLLQIISGQYVCQNTNTGSPLVEVEVIGIPVDCNRQRTKVVQRNSLNPIWNDTFMFRVSTCLTVLYDFCPELWFGFLGDFQ